MFSDKKSNFQTSHTFITVSSLAILILSEDCSLFGKEGLTVFQKHLFSVMCFLFKSVKYIFLLFVAVIHSFFIVYKITATSLTQKGISNPCPRHACFRDFRVNEKFVICSQIPFLQEACSMQIFEKVPSP